MPALGWALALVAANLAVFLLYAWDKLAARRGARRVPEARLLLCAAPGCAAGAWLAVLGLRHKTRKTGFLLALAAITALQVAAAVWAATRGPLSS